MRLISIILSIALLAACATPVSYQAGPAPQDPKKVIERVLFEQPSKTPEYVRVSDDYFEFGDGMVTDTNRWTRSSTSRQTTVRVYYRSVAKLKLYEKRGWWYVVPESKQGAEMTEVTVSNETDARQFADALTAMQGPR